MKGEREERVIKGEQKRKTQVGCFTILGLGVLNKMLEKMINVSGVKIEEP